MNFHYSSLIGFRWTFLPSLDIYCISNTFLFASVSFLQIQRVHTLSLHSVFQYRYFRSMFGQLKIKEHYERYHKKKISTKGIFQKRHVPSTKTNDQDNHFKDSQHQLQAGPITYRSVACALIQTTTRLYDLKK